MSSVYFLLYSAYNSYMLQRKKGSVGLKKKISRQPLLKKRAASVSRIAKKRIIQQANSSSPVRSRISSHSTVLISGKRVDISESHIRPIGTPMHPYMRTMFLSLTVGTIGVFASMLYYIHIARATENLLYQNTASRITAETAMLSADGSFTGLIQGLEEQRQDAGGALPIPPKEYLRLRAEKAGVSYALLNRIAYCESHWRMVDNKKSTASGYFQILDGTEQLTPQYRGGLRKTDPYVNIDMAISLYKKYGTIPWVESQGCWDAE